MPSVHERNCDRGISYVSETNTMGAYHGCMGTGADGPPDEAVPTLFA
jgi:hypothetical protein